MGWAGGSAAGTAESAAGADAGGGAGDRSVSGALPGIQREALPREAGGRTPDCVELQLRESPAAGSGAGAASTGAGQHRKRRSRRPLPGMLLHIDGSEHAWFQDHRHYDLIVVMDDANNEIFRKLLERKVPCPYSAAELPIAPKYGRQSAPKPRLH